MMHNEKRVFILGLDGVSFNVLKPMITKDGLPNFKRMMRRGVHSDLKSTIPANTAPAWISFMTGKNPGKHGVFDFHVPEPRGPDRILVSSRDIKSDTIWRILSLAKKKIVVINLSMTYPPEKVNGFIVPGWATPLSTNYTYPPELEEKREEYIQVWTGPSEDPYEMSKEDYVDYLFESLERLSSSSMNLLKRYDWDCFMLTITDTDDLLHFFLPLSPDHPFHDPDFSSRFGAVPLRYFRRIDGILGEIFSNVDEDTYVLVVSDHGMGSAHYKKVQINYWLKQAGLLKFRGESGNILSPLFYMNRILQRIMGLAGKLHIKIPGALQRRGEDAIGFFSLIDCQETKAWCKTKVNSLNGIWINTEERFGGIVDSGREYAELIDQLTSRLERLIDPQTGQRVIKRVFRRDELYRGEFSYLAPDLVLLMEDGYGATDSVSEERFVIPIREGLPGQHIIDGVFMAMGPGVKRGAELADIEIIDLAPTILHLMGLPIPSDMDGRVLKGMFEPGSELAEREVVIQKPSRKEREEKYVWKDEEKEEILRRLKELGYM